MNSKNKSKKIKTTTLACFTIMLLIIFMAISNINITIYYLDVFLQGKYFRNFGTSVAIFTMFLKLFVNFKEGTEDYFFLIAEYVTYGVIFYTFYNLTYVSFLDISKKNSTFKEYGMVDPYLFFISSVVIFLKPIPKLLTDWKLILEYLNTEDPMPVISE